tara:strand:+ start:1497 stop:1850 length:354 start_codon:yes stop_codon:yes gene_type:complete
MHRTVLFYEESMRIAPITPRQAGKKREADIPDEVIEAFNELIVEKLDNSGCATVLLKDAVSRVLAKFGDLKPSSSELFDNHWMDVEEIFIKAGWHVTFDKPGYNESYDASYEFRYKK